MDLQKLTNSKILVCTAFPCQNITSLSLITFQKVVNADYSENLIGLYINF